MCNWLKSDFDSEVVLNPPISFDVLLSCVVIETLINKISSFFGRNRHGDIRR